MDKELLRRDQLVISSGKQEYWGPDIGKIDSPAERHKNAPPESPVAAQYDPIFDVWEDEKQFERVYRTSATAIRSRIDYLYPTSCASTTTRII